MKFHKNLSSIFFLISIFTTSVCFADNIPIHVKCLWASYQNFKISADRGTILISNGDELPYRSRQPFGFVDPHHLTSIDQMFLDRYPYGFIKTKQRGSLYTIPTAKDVLRGNRYNRFFLDLYGHTAQHVENDLVHVRWVDGSFILFNRRYGAARALENVAHQLQGLIKKQPSLKKYLHSSGTYDWRHIASEKNMSMHAFGAAVDINEHYGDYWMWETKTGHEPHYRNRIPPAIVEVFEQNGFVWGGKWYHYDTMHFEFRPELVMNHSECERIFDEGYRD